MDLKQEFCEALQRGEDFDSLLELVHRHEARGLQPEEAYEILEQIWLSYGFNAIQSGDSLQDNLEYVMEKVWYERPARTSSDVKKDR